MLEYLPYRAAQVKYLTIHVMSRLNFDKGELFNLFPNLRELTLRGAVIINISNQARFLRTACKLTSLKDFADGGLVLQLARSNMCSNLKILELDFPYPTRLAHRSIISHLNNMPALEYLTLNNAKFGLTELETMQHNLHSIKRLHLKRADFASGPFPGDVIPSAQVTQLEIDIFKADDLATHFQVYEYFENKYSYIDGPVYLDRAIHGQENGYVLEVYNRGIFPLYQKIGSRLDTFKFTSYRNGLDAFNRFDNWGIKLKDLTIESISDDNVLFIENLVQSQQCKFIQKLVLKEIIPEPIDRVMNMEALSTLIIDCGDSYDGINYDRREMNFSQLIEACPPALTDLTVIGIDLIFNESTSHQTCIKHLKFSMLDLESELIRSIKTNFPQLLTLNFWGSLRRSVTISLPEHNLDRVDITLLYVLNDGFSIETVNDGNVQFYAPLTLGKLILRRHLRSYYKIIPVSKEELGDRRMWNIVCASVQKVSLSAR